MNNNTKARWHRVTRAMRRQMGNNSVRKSPKGKGKVAGKL